LLAAPELSWFDFMLLATTTPSLSEAKLKFFLELRFPIFWWPANDRQFLVQGQTKINPKWPFRKYFSKVRDRILSTGKKNQ
jgi:hypothetical protein